MPLGLTAATSERDAAIQNKIFGSGTTIAFSNEDCKSLEDAGLLIKSVTEKVENDVNEQEGRYLGILAATLGASLLTNMAAGKGLIPAGERKIEQNRVVNVASAFN